MFGGIGKALAVAALMALAGLAGPAAAVGIGGTCAGTAGLGCNAGLWCQLETGNCGRADAEGECVRVPGGCNLAFAPVCGCNGRTYGSDCERMRARVSKAHNGPCGGVRDRPRHTTEPDASQHQ